jgi:prepilin-type processing-associated H-X9-DG protein
MLFVDYPQLVCFQTDDKGGTDRGMDSASEKSYGVQTVVATGERHQLFRQIAPVHGLIKPSSRALTPFLTDGYPCLQGSINVAYCDGSVRTVDISLGLYGAAPIPGVNKPGNTADPSRQFILTDATNGGAVRSGGYAPVPGTRIDPTLAP